MPVITITVEFNNNFPQKVHTQILKYVLVTFDNQTVKIDNNNIFLIGEALEIEQLLYSVLEKLEILRAKLTIID